MNTSLPSAGDQAAFHHYAAYYDLLYRDKDYRAESHFVHDQLARHGTSGGRLLELGCGTGRHALEFASLGWDVKGYDLSPGMVAKAKQRAAATGARVAFEEGDIRRLRDPASFDAAMSLFHVMSYQNSDADLRAAIDTAARHLHAGGLFFFDFWYGPGVQHDPPAVREKRLADEKTSVIRHAVPVHDAAAHTVEVNYQIRSTDLSSGEARVFSEQHRLRYFDLPELAGFLGSSGLKIVDSGRWMDTKPADAESWYAWLIARKG